LLGRDINRLKMLQGILGIVIKKRFPNLVNNMLVMEKGNS
jgi:hypothetical protein